MSQVTVEIKGQESVSPAAKKVRESIQGIESDAKTLNTSFASSAIGATAVVAALFKVANIVGECDKAYAKSENELRTWQASMTQTGLITREGAARLDELSKSMSAMTGESELTIKGYEKMLANAGRNEEQIRKLITAAADYSAGSGKGMVEIINQLNKSFGGFAGELGETIPEIKNLTTAQLKAGDAVDFIAERYKGLASNIGETKLSQDAYNNAIEKLQSAAGRSLSTSLNPFRDWLTSIVKKWADATEEANNYRDAMKHVGDESAEVSKKAQIAILEHQKLNLEGRINVQEASDRLRISKGGTPDYKVVSGLYAERSGLSGQIAALSAELKALTKPSGTITGSSGGGGSDTAAESLASGGSDSWSRHYQAMGEAFVNDFEKGMKERIKNITWNDIALNRNRGGSSSSDYYSTEGIGGGTAPTTSNQFYDMTGTTNQSYGASSGTAPLDGLLGSIGPVADMFMEMFTSLSSVMQIMSPMKTILKAMFDVIGPLINSALAPLVGILKIIGNALGQVLTPVIVALGKVINFIMQGILLVWNGIVDAINRALGWAGVNLKHATLADAVVAGTDTTGTSGAAATYTKQRDITVNVTLYTQALVGDDGFRQFSLMVGRELKSAGILGQD